jgi:hypothetical protein
MKQLLFSLTVAIALLATSCQSNQRISRQLDGKWNVTKINNQSLPGGESMTIVFSKDKKGKGTGASTYIDAQYKTIRTFTYAVSNQKLIETYNQSGSDVEQVFTIQDHSRKKMVLIDAENEEMILESTK